MDISVILCTYNRSESLRQTLESLARMTLPPKLSWELILVDNNSSDNTKEVVNEFQQKSLLPLRYIFEGQQGKSFALNTGIKDGEGEILAFTDDDVTVDRYWLWQLKSTFDQLGCTGVAGKIVPLWTCEKPSWLKEDGPYQLMKVIVEFDHGEEPCEIKTPPFGANMAFKRVIFEKCGSFRTDLGPTKERLQRGEDTEFCRRLISGGEKLIYAPQAIVYHPVEKQRATKKYFQSWYFSYGRTLIRAAGVPGNTTYYFGIPKNLFRSLLGSILTWFFTIDSQRRFYFKLRFYQVLGQTVEVYNISRHSKRMEDTENP